MHAFFAWVFALFMHVYVPVCSAYIYIEYNVDIFPRYLKVLQELMPNTQLVNLRETFLEYQYLRIC